MHPTQNTKSEIKHFLEYASTNTDTVVKFRSSDMMLHIDSYASYLSALCELIHTGGHYYFNFQTVDPKKYPNISPPENGLIHTQCIILRHIVVSADK